MSYTAAQVQALVDAMWQLLDDMGVNGRSVCLAAKADARIAYEPFNIPDEDGDIAEVDYSLEDAQKVIAELG